MNFRLLRNSSSKVRVDKVGKRLNLTHFTVCFLYQLILMTIKIEEDTTPYLDKFLDKHIRIPGLL